MLRLLAAAALAAAPVAVPAQPPAQAPPVPLVPPATTPQGDYSHPASGAFFPRQVGAQRISRTADLGNPFDTIVDYSGDNPRESTTVYIFRAAVPDARLWFGHALATVGSQIPLAIFEAGPDQPLQAFGSRVPNALQRIYTTSRTGPFRSTALFVAQAGEWIVKMRVTSPTLDRDGLSARIAAFAAAIRFPDNTSYAVAAQPLPECDAPRFSGRVVEANAARLAAATGAGAAVLRRLREPLPDGGAGWCRVHGPKSDPILSLLRRTDGSGGWILLIGDAGRAFAAFAPGEIGLPADAATILVVAAPDYARVAALAQGVPDPGAVIEPLAAVLGNRNPGLLDYVPPTPAPTAPPPPPR
ncbi:MAG TPA: hypothetical protein VF702_05355 [Allosphingosinicella sp.]